MPKPCYKEKFRQTNNAGILRVVPTFKPNIYPIMYWALVYGVVAGTVLFLVWLLSQFITLVWMPIFLLGLVWGGYRNYLRQKTQWATQAGVQPTRGTAWEEFREAASDIAQASREVMNESDQAGLPPEQSTPPPPKQPENSQPPPTS